MFEESPRYRSYLLTLWEERGGDLKTEPTWRFSLEDPRSGKRRAFSSLEALFEYLKNEIEHRYRSHNQKKD